MAAKGTYGINGVPASGTVHLDGDYNHSERSLSLSIALFRNPYSNAKVRRNRDRKVATISDGQ